MQGREARSCTESGLLRVGWNLRWQRWRDGAEKT